MELLTTDEAAERLGMTPGRVRQLIRAGKLTPVRRIDKAYMLRTEDVDAYAQQAPPSVGWPKGKPRKQVLPAEQR